MTTDASAGRSADRSADRSAGRSAGRSRWPIASFVVSATVVAASCVYPLAALIGGPVSTLVGYLAYRSTRRSRVDRTRGAVALVLGAVPLALGVLWFGVALVVSGPAVFTG